MAAVSGSQPGGGALTPARQAGRGPDGGQRLGVEGGRLPGGGPAGAGGLDRRALAASEAIPTAPDHPARRWLAARALWRPTVALPPWLRWLPAEALAAVDGALL